MNRGVFIMLIALTTLLSACSNKTTNEKSTLTNKKVETTAKEYVDLFKDEKVTYANPSFSEPHISLEKDEYCFGDTINISCFNTNSTDWVGIYPYGGYPGDMNALNWAYANSDLVTIQAEQHKNETKYIVYLCDDDGYTVLDYKVITLSNSNDKNYQVKDAVYEYKDGIMGLTITPPTNRLISYEIYWAKDNKRLENYSYLKAFQKGSNGAFTYIFDKYSVMPSEANQLEIFVVNGKSESVFVNVDDGPKINSNYLYSFNVITDIHIQSYESKPNHVEHLQTALNDIYNYNPSSKALFIVGDSADTGSTKDYDCVTGLLNTYSKKTNVPLYYAIGNHEYVYAASYDNQISLFKKYTNSEDIFYTVELEGSTCIIMGSEEQTTAGEISDERVEWLKNELEKANKSKPIYIFLHQPLIDTVAGSYEKQNWYGITKTGKKIENILKDYPNTFLFTGHTHWEMESENNILVNESGTTYVNCSSVGYLWNDSDTGEPGSEGYFVDVYEDCIVIRGREFVKNVWLSYATYKIPLNFQK